MSHSLRSAWIEILEMLMRNEAESGRTPYGVRG